MPLYDRRCTVCAWATDFALEPFNAVGPPCPDCGQPTERYWVSGPLMVPDTFTTPLVDDVMTAERQVFHSRTEHRDAMRAHGLTIRDRHIGVPGTDKSKHTSRWI